MLTRSVFVTALVAAVVLPKRLWCVSGWTVTRLNPPHQPLSYRRHRHSQQASYRSCPQRHRPVQPRQNPHPTSVTELNAIDSRQLRFLGDRPAPRHRPSLSQQHGRDSRLSLVSNQTATENGMPSLPIDLNEYHPKRGFGPYLNLTKDERDLFRLLREARENTHTTTTLRVAGGWVRDKLLATPEFSQPFQDPVTERLTSKFKSSSSAASGAPSMGRQGTKILSRSSMAPVDIDIALDDMLGREFADRLNDYLSQKGEETISVGVVLKNPEKSKHLETATMKVGTFWIDFVNLRAEQYAQDSRIPDLVRIGTPAEDAFRRDLTINALFYNINNGLVEDWTGRGFDDLRRGIVATPLAPLTTLLDDPLRTLRSIRFAARLRFTMDDALLEAAMNSRVRQALAEKVSRERVGGEVDLMLRSPDPVGAMRLLINLDLVDTVFPTAGLFTTDVSGLRLFHKGLELLSTTHDHLWECQLKPPIWCDANKLYTTHGIAERTLMQDEEARRFMWYAAFLKPLYDYSATLSEDKKSVRQGKKANRSILCKLLVDELKRPARDAESVEKIVKAANDFTVLLDSGCDLSAISVLLSDIRVIDDDCTDGDEDDDRTTVGQRQPKQICWMHGRRISSDTEDDPVWQHAMEFRLLCSKVMLRIGPLWRAALFLSLSEQLMNLEGMLDYAIEGDMLEESNGERRQGVIDRYDAFAAALQRIGLVGIWNERPLLDGGKVKKVLPGIPKGPAFRDVMEEQVSWMTAHPGADASLLIEHLKKTFTEYQ